MKAKSFIDQVEVLVRSGRGGDGSSSMRREALVEFGGPDGGDGGRGGDVVFVASEHVNSLLSFYYDPKCFAQDGGNGQSQKMYGKRGKDLIVPVPLGTEVYDAETELLVADITEPGQRVIVAKGGAGGYGNVHFKSSVNQAPTERTLGGEPEERRLRLELKTIADAGLLGFPNAGKSSLLSSLSSATPKIASYPFTTLNPIVGTIVYDDFAKIAMADVPGIIEGAAKGVGLGLAFLKHLERSKVLVYVIDMAGTDNRVPRRGEQDGRRGVEGEHRPFPQGDRSRPDSRVLRDKGGPWRVQGRSPRRGQSEDEVSPYACGRAGRGRDARHDWRRDSGGRSPVRDISETREAQGQEPSQQGQHSLRRLRRQ